MKNEYMIKELARLYGVGTDTLRYYERLGLIRPRRGENGYRLYSLRDIYRLTIIRDLRQLGFSTDRISAYLDDLSIGNTQALLTEEQQLIRQRIKQLRQIDRAISERQKHLKQYAALPAGEISVRPVSERPCLLFNTDISRDEEVDFAIKKLHNRHADTIRDLGGQAIGAGMRLDEVRAGRFGHYHSVFFLLEPGTAEYDLLLPSGEYACLVYTGSYRAASCPTATGRNREAGAVRCGRSAGAVSHRQPLYRKRGRVRHRASDSGRTGIKEAGIKSSRPLFWVRLLPAQARPFEKN